MVTEIDESLTWFGESTFHSRITSLTLRTSTNWTMGFNMTERGPCASILRTRTSTGATHASLISWTIVVSRTFVLRRCLGDCRKSVGDAQLLHLAFEAITTCSNYSFFTHSVRISDNSYSYRLILSESWEIQMRGKKKKFDTYRYTGFLDSLDSRAGSCRCPDG